MFNTYPVHFISLIMTPKGQKHVGDYNSMSQWESHWNKACFRTMHMLNNNSTRRLIANSYEGFLLHMFGIRQFTDMRKGFVHHVPL